MTAMPHDESSKAFKVALIGMPFRICIEPSASLGLLKAILKSAGIAARVYNFNLTYLKYLREDTINVSDVETHFEKIPTPYGGEWLFSPRGTESEDHRALQVFARAGASPDTLAALRKKIPAFVDECCDELAREHHDILCFGCSFMQTRASLAVAHRAQKVFPRAKIVFGGASLYGDMGAALLQSFPVIDVACLGEGDLIIEPIIRALRDEPGYDLRNIPGISYRRAGRLHRAERPAPQVDINELPYPDYDEFFQQVGAMQRGGTLPSKFPRQVPLEAARGCWWGVKHACSFCGLNGDRMSFRFKDPQRLLGEMSFLSEAYKTKTLIPTDNIMAQSYFNTVIPALTRNPQGYELFWELKPNLRREQIAALARAGVRACQPGFEHFSTPVLKLLKKGVTALQNVQTLKWLSEYQIKAGWNLLGRVPGEKLEWMVALAKLISKLFHLQPPKFATIAVHRYSPYFNEPEKHGIELKATSPECDAAFPDVPNDLRRDLRFLFEYTIKDRDPRIDEYVDATIKPLLAEWQASHQKNGCTLSVIHGRTESFVVHGPFYAPTRLVRISGVLKTVLTLCESVCSEKALTEAPQNGNAHGASDVLEEEAYQDVLEILAREAQTVCRDEFAGSMKETLDWADEHNWIARENKRVVALPVNRTAFVNDPAFRRQIALNKIARLWRTDRTQNALFAFCGGVVGDSNGAAGNLV